jgi:hypothetical protein
MTVDTVICNQSAMLRLLTKLMGELLSCRWIETCLPFVLLKWMAAVIAIFILIVLDRVGICDLSLSEEGEGKEEVTETETD